MYLVKGYVGDGETRKNVSILVEATGCMDAISLVAETDGMTDVTSVSLSPIKEVIRQSDKSENYFTATVQTLDDEETAMKYQLLVVADDFDSAQKTIKEELKQGYEMTLIGLKKTKLYSVVDVAPLRIPSHIASIDCTQPLN